MDHKAKRVLVIEAQIKQYRVPFYAGLRNELSGSGIELRVGYSGPSPEEASKSDNDELPREYGRKVKAYWLVRNRVLFQPLLLAAMNSDLVIVEQANKFVLNHLLLPLSRLGVKRVAFWGLGENLQAGQLRFSEWYRRKTLNWVSWWFAYTKDTARYLVKNDVPEWKITAVDNAVDTSAIREHVTTISATNKAVLRSQIGIGPSARVGIFCGMLDRVKGVSFLFEAAEIIRGQVGDFHLLLLGGGPEQASLQRAVHGIPWIHFMGPQFGTRKSELIAISDVFLMPGRVGLVTLDAFASGLPLLSTRLKIHGPEIEYLQEGINGLVSEPEVSAFANMTVSLLQDRERLRQLQRGAWESGSKYTIDNMVANFKAGIESCLAQQRGSPMSLLTDRVG